MAVDWTTVDLEAIIKDAGDIIPRHCSGEAEVRSVRVGITAVGFLVGIAQRSWFLRRIETRQRPLHPREAAYHKYLISEQEYISDERNAMENIDLDEVLAHLACVSAACSADPLVCESASHLRNAVTAIKCSTLHKQFLRFVKLTSGPPTTYQEEYKNFMATYESARHEDECGDPERGPS